MSQPNERTTGTTSEVDDELNLTKRIKGVVEDYVTQTFTQMEQRINKMVDDKVTTIVKEKEELVERELRKYFGVDKDPVITRSELTKAIRQLQLDTTETGKRSPASPEKEVGPAGNTTLIKGQKGTANQQVSDLFARHKVEAK